MFGKRETDDNGDIPENEHNRCQGLHFDCLLKLHFTSYIAYKQNNKANVLDNFTNYYLID